MDCRCLDKVLKIISIILIIVFLIGIFILLVVQNTQEEQKNILTAVARPGDNTEVGVATINFSQNEIMQGTAITHEPGSNQIQINETGFYRISYQLFGTQDTLTTFNFNAIILLNGTGLENTINESPVLRQNVSNRMTLTSSVILQLNSGDVISLQGFSIEDITYENARIDINKL